MRSEIKILIAYDGKETSPPIFDDLKLAGLPTHAEVVLLSVGELWLVPPSLYGMYEPDYTEEFLLDLKNARILAEKACEQIAQFFPDWKLQPEAGLGSPVERILEIADKIQPDLIVVGSHSRTALGRIVIGSVSQKIVTEAHCSVRVAREHSIKEEHPPRIIVAVDGSPGSIKAVQEVAQRVWPEGTEVQLITSIRFGSTKEKEYVENVHQEMSRILLENKIKASTLIKEGDPKYVLVQEAEAWKADAIFMGSRGLGRIKRLLLGSVSTAVVASAHCSVEVIR